MRVSLNALAWIQQRLLATMLISTGAICVAARGHAEPRQRALSVTNRIERPASQAGVHNTVNYIERSITWPSGTYSGLFFDYFVDSETGYDFLRLKIDGNLVAQWAGPSRSGQFHYAVEPGTHVVRFEYVKDGSVNAGRDTAWVDNVVAQSATGLVSQFAFNARDEALSGWSAGGPQAGWALAKPPVARVLRRPSSQAFTGYQQSPSVSSVERTVSLTGTANSIQFDYFVDSEPGYDFLRAYVDGVQVFAQSGQKEGSATLPVTSGSHVIRFAYTKDTSVDTGLDTALIDNVRLVSDAGTVEFHEFDGVANGSVPYGWAANGSQPLWVIADRPPGEAAIGVSSGGAPTLNGYIDQTVSGEYAAATAIPLTDDIRPYAAKKASVELVSTAVNSPAAAQYLTLGVRAPAKTPAPGGETGSLTILLDDDRLTTLRNQSSCAGAPLLPSSSDRKIVVTYTDASWTAQQFEGNCAGWVMTSSPLPINAAIAEPSTDVGFVHIEVSIDVTATQGATQGLLGLGLAQRNTAGSSNLTDFTLPLQPSHILDESNTMTWMTLRIGVTKIEPGLESTGKNMGQPKSGINAWCY